MNKILLPSNDGQSNLVQDTLPTVPEGFYRYDVDPVSDRWTLMDERGRINISWIFNAAKVKDPTIVDKRPVIWLRNKSAKDLRSNYQTLLGFDPVKTIRGGDRIKDQSPNSDSGQKGNRQSEISHFGDSTSIQNISANGKVQTYGTYMTDDMFISYAMWVSFDFYRYVLSFVKIHGGSLLDQGSLIHSTDRLHHENFEINKRHANLVNSIKNVKPNFKYVLTKLFDIQRYVSYLRSDFNINISVPELLKFYCNVGLFYRSILTADEAIDMYLPKPEYVSPFGSAPMFTVGHEGSSSPVIFVMPDTHNATINEIVELFGQIPSDDVNSD